MIDNPPDPLRRIHAPRLVDDLVRWAARVCSLGTVVATRVSDVGYDDCNIMVDTENGGYVVKVFNSARTPAMCARYVEVVRRVLEAGVAHPGVYHADGSPLLHHEPSGNRLMVMDRVDGTTFLEADEHPSDLEIEEIVGQLHRVHSLDFAPEHVHDWWAVPRIETLAAEMVPLLEAEDRALVTAAVDAFRALRADRLPQAFSHGDLTKANVMRTRSGELAILDFAVSNRYARIHDLAMAAVNLMHKDPRTLPERVDLLTRLYRKHAPLTGAELDALPGYVFATAAMELLGAEREWSLKGNRSHETRYLRALGREMVRAAAV
ncbi:hypothetical protein GCM10010420_06600 [Streptomyces glaucosporus]|uniref:Aminoglycoside phosphotransferase domain-containing protein n=1 Tax=Streptomyces glaucosporus TaxID=284044 RepID=A0ABP5UUZ3_9ACTN